MRHKMMKVGMLAGTLALFAAGAFVYPQNLTTLAARQLYDVREMLAALVLFSVGFAVIAVVILILFLLDRGLYRVLALTRSYATPTVQRLHRGWVQVEHLRKASFRL